MEQHSRTQRAGLHLHLVSNPRLSGPRGTRPLKGVSLLILREIAASPGQRISKADLSLTLWPSASHSVRSHRLAQRLYWIRKNIGSELCPALTHSLVLLADDNQPWTDILALQHSVLIGHPLDVAAKAALDTTLSDGTSGPAWKSAVRRLLAWGSQTDGEVTPGAGAAALRKLSKEDHKLVQHVFGTPGSLHDVDTTGAPRGFQLLSRLHKAGVIQPGRSVAAYFE